MSRAWGDAFGDAWADSWGDGESPTVEVKAGTGGDDKRRKKLHLPFKPTGLLDRPSRRKIEQRVVESRQASAEVSAKLSAEFTQEPAREATSGSLSAIDREISALLHEEMQAEDTKIILMLVAACV